MKLSNRTSRSRETKSRGSFLLNLLPGSRHNYGAEVGDGTRSALAMAPILWVARVFPEMPVQLAYEGEPVADHPMLDLWNEPNPHYSGSVLAMGVITSMLSDGNAYILKRRNARGVVRELWYVPHLQIEPGWTDADEFIGYYRYSGPSGSLRLAPEDVIHIRYGIDPANTRKGVSNVKLLAREIATDDYAANYSASILRNLGIPGLIITPKAGETIDPADATDIKKYIKQKFSGDGAGEPFATSLPIDLQPFGVEPGKMDLKALRAMPETRVCAVIGIPVQVLGLAAGHEQSTYLNYAEARRASYQDCIIPMQRLISEELRSQLLSEWEPTRTKWRVGYDLRPAKIFEEDETAKYNRINLVWGSGLITRDKALSMLGIPEDENTGEFFR